MNDLDDYVQLCPFFPFLKSLLVSSLVERVSVSVPCVRARVGFSCMMNRAVFFSLFPPFIIYLCFYVELVFARSATWSFIRLLLFVRYLPKYFTACCSHFEKLPPKHTLSGGSMCKRLYWVNCGSGLQEIQRIFAVRSP